MTLSATGCLFLLIWRSLDTKCREFPLLGLKNGWDWPSLEWQPGCMTLSTRNTILTLSCSRVCKSPIPLIIMTISRLYSQCHESLLPQRESFEGDREKAITKRGYLEERPPWWRPVSQWTKHFEVESQRLELIETLQDLNDHIILRLISSLSYFIAHWLDLLRWYRLPN